jgi:hypothetical protein
VNAVDEVTQIRLPYRQRLHRAQAPGL